MSVNIPGNNVSPPVIVLELVSVTVVDPILKTRALNFTESVVAVGSVTEQAEGQFTTTVRPSSVDVTEYPGVSEIVPSLKTPPAGIQALLLQTINCPVVASQISGSERTELPEVQEGSGSAALRICVVKPPCAQANSANRKITTRISTKSDDVPRRIIGIPYDRDELILIRQVVIVDTVDCSIVVLSAIVSPGGCGLSETRIGVCGVHCLIVESRSGGLESPDRYRG